MNSYRQLIIIVLLILASGCVGSYENATKGVTVLDFKPDFPTVHSGEDVTFRLRIKNEGNIEAKNGFVEILGLDFNWKSKEGKSEEILPNEDECKYTIRKIYLLPRTSSTEGGEQICTWNYKAPVVDNTVEYKPKARVYYDYQSLLTKSITIVPKEKLKIYQDTGRSLPSGDVNKVEGPISLELSVETPIRTYDGKINFPVTIEIENVGGGTACPDANSCRKSSGKLDWNSINVEIRGSEGMDITDCQNALKTKGDKLYLINGKEQKLTCKVSVDASSEITQKTMFITANYGYFIDKESYIKVLPKA